MPTTQRESIVCHDYPNCDREHAGGMGGTPVHPPEGASIRPGYFDSAMWCDEAAS